MTRFFFYGTLKEGHGLHKSLGLGPKICDFLLKDHRIYSLRFYPCIVPEKGFDVQGEIHEVEDEEKAKRIDDIERSAGYRVGVLSDSDGKEFKFYYFPKPPKWGSPLQTNSWTK